MGLVVIGLVGVVVCARVQSDELMYFPDTPFPTVAASSDPEVIARGRYLVYGPARSDHLLPAVHPRGEAGGSPARRRDVVAAAAAAAART